MNRAEASVRMKNTEQTLPKEECDRLLALPALAGSMPVVFSNGSMFATDGRTRCPKCNRELEFYQTRGEVVRLFHDVYEMRLVTICNDCHIFTTAIIRLKPGELTALDVDGAPVQTATMQLASKPYWLRRVLVWLKETMFPG